MMTHCASRYCRAHETQRGFVHSPSRLLHERQEGTPLIVGWVGRLEVGLIILATSNKWEQYIENASMNNGKTNAQSNGDGGGECE